MKLPSFKLGKKRKQEQQENNEEENSTGKKPSKGLKKMRLKGFMFVMVVLIGAAVGMSGVAYAYLYFTGNLETVLGEIVKPKENNDDNFDTLLSMYELQNTQAGKIEELQSENTVLIEENEVLETKVELYKTEIDKIEPGKSEEIEEMAKPAPPPPEEEETPSDAENMPAKPTTFPEPEGSWQTNEKISEKLSDGTIAEVKSWNEKYGGWICKGIDEQIYLIIPSGTMIEAVLLGL